MTVAAILSLFAAVVVASSRLSNNNRGMLSVSSREPMTCKKKTDFTNSQWDYLIFSTDINIFYQNIVKITSHKG